MLKTLLKKQLREVFRNYFFNRKANKARSKAGIVAMFALYALLMIGILGGIFTALSVAVCAPFAEAGMTWFYFALMGILSILLGTFGSVFATYQGLYMSKDNDLLLSMPIPLKYIVASRLMNVYVLGIMYAWVVILPAEIVYWVVCGITAANLVCGILLMLFVSLIVLLLSTTLGWAVAKISRKIKNKSFVTVAASLVFVAAYYYFCGQAGDLIQEMIANVVFYGQAVREKANVVYAFGTIGTGNFTATGITAAILIALTALSWLLLSRSFLSIATGSGRSEKRVYREKTVRRRSPFAALLVKEFKRFTASSNYMLNGALGVLFLPVAGILMLARGKDLLSVVAFLPEEYAGCVAAVLCAALCMLSCMIDTAPSSVSLEGKSIWIPQSLPVPAKTVLRAKCAMQLLLSAVPTLFACVCVVCVLPIDMVERVLLCVVPLLFCAFLSLFGSALGVAMANLTWTNEVIPIKQSGAVSITLLGGWAVSIAMGGLYFLLRNRLTSSLYLALCGVLFAAVSLLLLRWLDTKGAKRFAEL